MKKRNYEDVKEEDIIGEVKFKVDKNAFKGPFTCHGKRTINKYKTKKIGGLDFSYEVWQCQKCKEEYVDSKQSKKLEKIWLIEKMLEDKAVEIHRAVNFDGKTYFLRFPKDVTKKWHKGITADIKLLSSDEFLVKVNT